MRQRRSRVGQAVKPALVVVLADPDERQTVRAVGPEQARGLYFTFMACVVGSLLGTTVVHELGHPGVALLLSLPVVHVALLPSRRSGHLAHVRIKPNAFLRALPLRMILSLLAGPAVNLATAGLGGSVRVGGFPVGGGPRG